MILVIDNYDSFVHNLARYFTLAGAECMVVRNDAMTVEQAARMNPEAIVISPGPGKPQDSGISIDIIKKLGANVPILGVCLGHQCIGEAYGGKTVRGEPMHGQASNIRHDGRGIFDGIPDGFQGGRYHSLITQLPENSPLRVTARADDGTTMAVEHATHPVYGVQFHPESVLTEHGMVIIQNFLRLARQKERLAA